MRRNRGDGVAVAVRATAMVVAMLGVLSACSTAQPPSLAPVQTFGQPGAIALNAATIQIIDQYRPPMVRPNVDHESPIPPAQAVRRWVADRLKATGRSGTVQVIIRDASIVEKQLPHADGLKSLFTTQQTQQYDGRVEVRVVGRNPELSFSGYAEVAASRSTTVPEDISLAGREETWNTLVRQMIADLDARLAQGLQDGLGPMLRR